MPVFWSGLMLIWLFYGKLEWLPGRPPERLHRAAGANHRYVHGGQPAHRQLAGALGEPAVSGAASLRARLRLHGDAGPHDPIEHAGGARSGLHPDGPRQGPDRPHGGVAARAPQRADPGHHAGRAWRSRHCSAGPSSPRRSSRGRASASTWSMRHCTWIIRSSWDSRCSSRSCTWW